MLCPNCKRPTAWQDNPNRPFCSERCRLIDFGAWANEEYKVPAEERARPWWRSSDRAKDFLIETVGFAGTALNDPFFTQANHN